MSKLYQKTQNGLVNPSESIIKNFTTYEEAQQALGSTLVEGQIISINAPTGNGVDLEEEVNNIAALIPAGTAYPNNMLVNASMLSDLDVGALSNRVDGVSTRIDGIDSVIPSTASASNKLTTASQLADAISHVDLGSVSTRIDSLDSAVSTLNTASGIYAAQISTLNSDKQDKALSAVVSIGSSTFNTVESALQGVARLKADLSRVTDIEEKIPSTASDTNQLVDIDTMQAITSQLSDSIDAINLAIPSDASQANMLTTQSEVSTMIDSNPAFSMLLNGTTLTITSL